ncbi:glycerol-3-phosphate dehydrogenase [NAD(P)+] [Thiomicrorhabdus immobilis]|uniref:Glycerol-3-phosphate dehydrogenase [NAD(P)+] n=1 Tax=Thiomicrorhabdus immobilis TaxID=2791037 RepID=A0ABN6CYS4_9GAMM|nr:NAD(P)H-dependent glycerol-3-phosphate dehydrogenase [Thiomicrorhabdus immobilis]BCN94228.1 glycerol-3-phosphate dehydrogenase [NAD(P)+] [Thiomicrorhabdus immobilis]
MSSPRKIAVLGAGAWGTALALHLAKVGHAVNLWTHREEQAQQLRTDHENARYLPGIKLPDNLNPVASLVDALYQVEGILLVVPSNAFRQTLMAIKEVVASRSVHIAWATKGFEPVTQKLLHEVAFEVLGDTANVTVLSGPTFANEVAKGLPTAMVSASNQEQEAQYWADLFHCDSFRMYTQSDMIGVEVGGAYKNIMAIATGISDGLGMGANARAALVSRGMVEMMRLSQALGGQTETMMGLAGLGDLVLTCTDDLSRNRRFGFGLARGDMSSEQVMNEIGQVVEGAKAVKTVKQLADKLGLDLPIMEQVYLLVSEKISPQQAVKALMTRSGKSE